MTNTRTAAHAAATPENLAILRTTYANLALAGLPDEELQRTVHEQWVEMKQAAAGRVA